MESRELIVLLGNKHSGKSTVGRLLSLKTGIPFFDLDDLIHKKIKNDFPSIRSFCEKEGMEKFRAVEKETVVEFWEKAEKEKRSYILALGGGTAENQETVSVLKNGGKLIYLSAKADTLFERIKRGGIPPFLKSDNPRKEFGILFENRDNIYRSVADITIDTDNKTPEKIVKLIKGKIES